MGLYQRGFGSLAFDYKQWKTAPGCDVSNFILKKKIYYGVHINIKLVGCFFLSFCGLFKAEKLFELW